MNLEEINSRIGVSSLVTVGGSWLDAPAFIRDVAPESEPMLVKVEDAHSGQVEWVPASLLSI